MEIEDLLVKLRALEDEIDEYVDSSRAKFVESIENGKAKFTEATLAEHRALKIALDTYILGSNFAHIITAPFIYGMIIPFVFLDFSLWLYQITCFTAWKIPRVKRNQYFVIDRQHLQYLNLIEKINCMFCGYGNGLFAYAREVASVTEQYWCPIKHALRVKDPHSRYREFVDYGDATAYKAHLKELRDKLRAKNNP